MTYEPFDIVVVPFPFTDAAQSKHRPALVLSQNTTFGAIIGHSVLAMITSQKNEPWPLDVSIITPPAASGLTAPSVVRMKLFTLDHRLVLKKIGTLSKADQASVKQNLSAIFDYLWRCPHF